MTFHPLLSLNYSSPWLREFLDDDTTCKEKLIVHRKDGGNLKATFHNIHLPAHLPLLAINEVYERTSINMYC